MDLFFQQLVNGLTLGSLYALIAVGYTVVYGIVQLINFAHGEVFMIGAFGALATWSYLLRETTAWWALPIMIIGAIVCSVVTAVIMERFAYRPLRHAHGSLRSSPPSASRSSSRKRSGSSTPAPRASCPSRRSTSSRGAPSRSAG